MNQEALTVAAAEHGKRRRSRTEHGHALHLGRGVADAAGDRLGFHGLLR